MRYTYEKGKGITHESVFGSAETYKNFREGVHKAYDAFSMIAHIPGAMMKAVVGRDEFTQSLKKKYGKWI